MREIKFRVWDKENEKWVNPLVIPLGVGLMDMNDLFKIRNWIFIQYTGLKDKNGKEIYEGDIIKRHNGEIGFVEFRHGTFDINRRHYWNEKGRCYIRQLEFLETNLDSFEHCKIIGNICENPELLE